MRLEGHLRFVDLGMGQWVLETGDGDRRPLLGDIPEALRDQRVVIEGRPVARLGFGVDASASVEVASIRRA